MSRKGKIARLDVPDRDEVCRMLLANRTGRQVVDWIHAQPRCVAILKEHFVEDWQVSDQNISAWRLGGFEDWKRQRDRIAEIGERARFAAEVARAGNGTLSDGAAAIVAGKLLDVLEGLDDEKPTPETLDALTLALSRLRAGDHTAEKLRLTTLRLDQTAELLALEKQKFIASAREKLTALIEAKAAQNILNGTGSTAEKTEQLGQHIFGDLWK